MYIQKIHIENFRLLKNVDIVLDKSLTLIVGKNNTGKTSVAHLLQSIINEKKNLSFNDYPLECRKQLYEALEKYWAGQLKNTEIKNQIEETNGSRVFLFALNCKILVHCRPGGVLNLIFCISANHIFDAIACQKFILDVCHLCNKEPGISKRGM